MSSELMSATTTGYREAAEKRGAGSSSSQRRIRGRDRGASRLAGFRAALEANDGALSSLERAGDDLCRALGCMVAITRRDGRGETAVLVRARPEGFGEEPSPDFLLYAAERLAQRGRALSLPGNAKGGGPGIHPARHYVGLPAPREVAARHALHLFAKHPLSAAKRRLARAAADALGLWALRYDGGEDNSKPSSMLTGPPAALPDAGEVAIEQLLSDAMRAAAETLSADTCSLMVADEAKGALVVDASYGLDEGIIHDPRRRTGQGIASQVVSLGHPVILRDPLKDPRLRGLPIEPRPDIKSSLCVPISLREGLRGVVSFNRTGSAEPFTPADLQLARTVAAQLGPCVANARLYQQAAEQLGEMTAINRLAEAVTPATDLKRAAELFAAGIARAADLKRCRVFLVEGARMTLVATYGYPAAAHDAPPPSPHGAIARAAAEGHPVKAADSDADRPSKPLRAFAALPITCRGRTLGVLCADCDDRRALDRLDLGMLEKLLTRAALALDNAAAHQRLREDLNDLYRLYDGVQRVNASFDPEDILEQTARGVQLLAGCREVGFAALGSALAPGVERATPNLRLTHLALDGAGQAAARTISEPVLLTDHRGEAPPGIATLAQQLSAQTGDRNLLIVPLAHEHGSLGLAVGWGFSREANDRGLSLAAGLCTHAAALLRKAMDYQAAIRQRSLELSALYQLCEEISTATSFESALRSVLDIAHSMVRYDEGYVFIWNEERSRLELAACRGADLEAMRAQAPQAQPGNLYQWVFAEGKAFMSTDIARHESEAGGAGQVLRSSMAVPLVVGNETIGVLAIHSALSRAYTEEHVKVLSIVASQAAAIYRALQSLGSLSRYTDNILQSIVAGVIGLDRAGTVVIWSPAAERIFGPSSAEAVGAEFLTLVHDIGRKQGGHGGPSLESLGLVARQVLADGEPCLEHELRLGRDREPPLAALASCTPLRAADGDLVGAVLLVEDITERKRMEERMRQMSQLAAVGHLAANVAHEIRNPLSAIKTAAQFLRKEYSRDSFVAEFAGIINEECDRLGKVATSFLAYAHPNEPALERVALTTVVDSALGATARELARRRIEVAWRPPKRLPKIWADPDAMRQVFVNLLINAAQAIGRNGKITVRLRACRDGQQRRAVEAIVTDTGPGIADDNMDRVWAPFFSTKAKGTGLGLSIVRKTVEAHGGQVWAQAPPGGGAAFRLRLPLDRVGKSQRPTEPAAGASDVQRWRQLDLFEHYPARPANEPEPVATVPQGAQG